jgi:archaeal flagellin N-terminal-like domain
MDFKKLFRKDDKAVSPVIGVILMVAITVILAAAIGSSVFSHGAAQTAPQANLNIKAAGPIPTTGLASVNIEHLGGDPVNFATTSIKIMASVNGGSATQIFPGASPVTMNVGDIQKLDLKTLDTDNPNLKKLGGADGKTPTNLASGDVVNLKFIDIKSGQIFLDKNVAF